MLRLILALVLCLAPFAKGDFYGGQYGGNGGDQHTLLCGNDEVVRAVALKHGSGLDRIAIRCTNQNWSHWLGGSGGGYKHRYSSDWGFCGMNGKSGTLVDRLCLQEPNGHEECWGGYGGGDFKDRDCNDSPGDNRVRLRGFRLRTGARIDQIEPIWKIYSCADYLTVNGAPAGSAPYNYAGLNGQYQFHKWTSGHHNYKQVGGNNCIFYKNGSWRMYLCSEVDTSNSWYLSLSSSNQYEYCVQDLTGSSHWKSPLGAVYPHLGITVQNGITATWGNAVGYWEEFGSGQGYGDSATLTVSRYTESSTGYEFSQAEQNSFFSTESFSQTAGTEVGVSSTFSGMTTSAKWSYAATLSQSTTQGVRQTMTNALSYATSDGTSMTISCTTQMPNAAYRSYVWTTYRASSIENTGASQQTCNFQHQSGPCKFVPPNCPVGTCLGDYCINCQDGITPLQPVSNLMAQYPECFDEINGQNPSPTSHCTTELNNWTCCTNEIPCQAGEGDCDNDAECAGSLVCIHEPGFDVCGYPSGRRLLDLEEASASFSTSEEEVTVMAAAFDPLTSLEEDEEAEHEPASGCEQFDDEGHCETGPLYQFCSWNDAEGLCSLKDDVDTSEMPTTDFTWIYDL